MNWTHAVVLGNDSREGHEVVYRVIDAENGEMLLCGSTFSPANENVTLDHIREMAGELKLYLLLYTVEGVEYANHYISVYPHFDAERMKR